MLYLYFSLSSPFLFLALGENNRCLISLQKENQRLHSDNFLFHLNEILERINRNLTELNEIYFTSFPSGQTGLRVSLAFLTTLQVVNPEIKFYQINTLLLQAGNDNCISLLTIDKQESKYYLAIYKKKRCLLTTKLVHKKELSDLIKKFSGFVVRKDFWEVDLLSHFQALKNKFTRLNKIEKINL